MPSAVQDLEFLRRLLERYTALSRDVVATRGYCIRPRCRESVVGDDISLTLGHSTHSQLHHILAGARVRGLPLWPYRNQRKEGEIMKAGLWATSDTSITSASGCSGQGWRSSA